MKKKTQSFTCQVCGATHHSPQGISAHVRHAHSTEWMAKQVDNKGRHINQSTKFAPDTKGKITAAEVTEPEFQDVIDSMRYVNTSTPEPFHYAILRDFEEAVREHRQERGVEMSIDEGLEKLARYNRAKRLLALRILLLKTRADMADMLERELLS